MVSASPPDDFWATFRAAGSPFLDLSDQVLRQVSAELEPREFAVGDYLIREGEAGHHLFVVRRGQAEAYVGSGEERRHRVAAFSVGDVVGEMSLVTDEPRMADVVATTPLAAYLLTRRSFEDLARRHPELPVVLTNVVADRLGRATYDGLGGKDLHGHRIARCVGRGGMGIVYEARRMSDGRTVALKMMNHRLIFDPEALRRFQLEARTLQRLRHDAIAPLFGRFAAYKTEFFVTEFYQGRTLRERLEDRPRLDPPAVRALVGQLAGALAYVHAEGWVHRDLKPSNVMITDEGAVKLLDFGLARPEPGDHGAAAFDVTESNPFSLLGTPRYMAPEQFSAEAFDHRIDLYALAAIAYEALTGIPVTTAPDLLRMVNDKLRFEMPPADAVGPGIADDLHRFLVAGLKADPAERAVSLPALAAWAAPLPPG